MMREKKIWFTQLEGRISKLRKDLLVALGVKLFLSTPKLTCISSLTFMVRMLGRRTKNGRTTITGNNGNDNSYHISSCIDVALP
jgi:hypothetical protein